MGNPPPPEMKFPHLAEDAAKIYSTLVNRLNLYILLDPGFQGVSGHAPFHGFRVSQFFARDYIYYTHIYNVHNTKQIKAIFSTSASGALSEI